MEKQIEKLKGNERKINEKGITLLVLVVTIVLLLILSGITISSLAGDNGLINSAIRAKENSEIDGEKEIVETSVVQAMGKDKYGDYYDVTIAQDGGVITNANSSYLFSNIGASVSGTVTIDGLQYFDTSETTNMSCMFYNCSKVTSLNLSRFDTSNVTSMGSMFFNVPTTVEITTNTAMKTWLNTNFASYTNIVTID